MTSKETNDSSTRCYYHKLSVQKLIEEQSKNEGKEKKNDRLPEQRIDLLRPKGQYQQKGEMGNSEVRKQQKKKQISRSATVEAADGDDRDAQCLYCCEFWSASAVITWR